MQGVVECAQGDTPPPDELQLLWQCEQFHTLPEAGGLWDQPAGMMERLRKIGYVYTAMKAYHNRADGNAKETSEMLFVRQYPEYWKTVQAVMQMEKSWQVQ